MSRRYSNRGAIALSTLSALAGIAPAALGGEPTGWTQQARVAAADGTPNSYFGFAVALSGDTALIAATGAFDIEAGAVYPFTRAGSTWAQQSKIQPIESADGDGFGTSLAFDGDTLVVGAVASDQQGRAFVFVRSGDTWTEQSELVSVDGSGNYYGASVAIDGDTAIVGSLGQNAAYVFQRTGEVWSQQQKLQADDMDGVASFGRIALDADRVLIGAPDSDAFKGRAFVFDRVGTTWTQSAGFAPDAAGANDLFGESVALQGDTAFVASYGFDNYRGEVYVYALSQGTWTFQTRLRAEDGAQLDGFGVPIAVVGDTVAIGAGYAATDFLYQGAVYVYRGSGDAWKPVAKLVADDGAREDLFGFQSVAMDQGNILAGAIGVDIGTNTDQGAAYIFTPDPSDAIFSSGFD
jgi:hypothetical protein